MLLILRPVFSKKQWFNISRVSAGFDNFLRFKQIIGSKLIIVCYRLTVWADVTFFPSVRILLYGL